MAEETQRPESHIPLFEHVFVIVSMLMLASAIIPVIVRIAPSSMTRCR